MSLQIAQVQSQHAFLHQNSDWSSFDVIAFSLQKTAHDYGLYLCRLSLEGRQAVVIANQYFNFKRYWAGQVIEVDTDSLKLDLSFASRVSQFLQKINEDREYAILSGLNWTQPAWRQYAIA